MISVTAEIVSNLLEVTATIINYSTAGTIRVYLDGVLQSTTSSTDLNSEVVNILWT